MKNIPFDDAPNPKEQEKVVNQKSSTQQSSWRQRRFWSNLSLKKLEEKIKFIFSILARGLSAMILFFLIFGSLQGLFTNDYIFTNFNVPSSYEKQGISGEVLKMKLADKIIALPELYAEGISTTKKTKTTDGNANDEDKKKTENNKKAENEYKKKTYAFTSDTDVVDDDIEIMGISLNAVKSMIREFLGIQNRTITGNLIEHENELNLELKINGKQKKSIVFIKKNCEGRKKACLDSLIEEAAVYVLSQEESLLTSFYYYEIDDLKKAEESLKKVLTTEDRRQLTSTSIAKAYHLWGVILQERAWDELDEADETETSPRRRQRRRQEIKTGVIAKFEKATQQDSTLVKAWVDWGDFLFELYNYDYEFNEALEDWPDHKNDKLLKQQLQETMSKYQKGQAICQISSNKHTKNEDCLDSYYYYDGLLYNALFRMMDNTKEQAWLNHISSLPDGIYYEISYQEIAKQLIESERYNIGLQLYFRYFDHLIKNDLNSSDKRNLAVEEELVYLSSYQYGDHNCINALRATQKLHSTKKISTATYHLIIEQLAYLEWEYHIFSNYMYEQEMETELEDAPTIEAAIYPEEPQFWSTYSQLPDPKIAGGILDSLTESLWYYLHFQYQQKQYLLEGKYHTQSPDYLERVKTFSDQDLEDLYFDIHGVPYENWRQYIRKNAAKIVQMEENAY
ncbi:MAG: hypothetical protein AAF806_14005 [Bacteroidota bacterium]